jgi:uncharacterized membrane protein
LFGATKILAFAAGGPGKVPPIGQHINCCAAQRKAILIAIIKLRSILVTTTHAACAKLKKTLIYVKSRNSSARLVVLEQAMGLLAIETEACRTWLVRPNRSLSVRGSQALLLAIATVSAVIVGAFALIGAWPVIPFAGAELAMLWWALKRIEGHSNDFERITLKPGLLTVETRLGSRIDYREFPAYWTRLECLKDHRLLIRSHGKEIEIGSLLTEEQKMTLAKALKQELGSR